MSQSLENQQEQTCQTIRNGLLLDEIIESVCATKNYVFVGFKKKTKKCQNIFHLRLDRVEAKGFKLNDIDFKNKTLTFERVDKILGFE